MTDGYLQRCRTRIRHPRAIGTQPVLVPVRRGQIHVPYTVGCRRIIAARQTSHQVRTQRRIELVLAGTVATGEDISDQPPLVMVFAMNRDELLAQAKPSEFVAKHL